MRRESVRIEEAEQRKAQGAQALVPHGDALKTRTMNLAGAMIARRRADGQRWYWRSLALCI
jgi:hypothetical protein